MSVLQSGITKSLAEAYTIDQSCRFNDDSESFLSLAYGSSGNQKTWTFSCWTKRGELTTQNDGLLTCDFGSRFSAIAFMTSPSAGANLQMADATFAGGGSYQTRVASSACYRDPAAWYHIVVKYDTTESVASDRVKLYVNGDEVTDLSESTYPSLNYDGNMNYGNGSRLTGIGKNGGTGDLYDGYIAEVYFIDGTALDASSFGETDSSTNQWIPKDASGLTFGTNGFYLDFADSADLGDDESGEGNDFTSNNLSTWDQVPDSPTNNFCTNNRAMRANLTQSEGNLKIVGVGTNYDNLGGTVMFDVTDTDGWYWEYYSIGNDSDTEIGLSKPDNPLFNQSDSASPTAAETGSLSYRGSGQTKVSGSNSAYGDSWTAGDIIGIAVKSGAVWWSKNGTWQDSATAAEIAAGTTTNAATTGLTGNYVTSWSINGTQSGISNFGQDSSFAGTVTAQGNQDANSIGDFYYALPGGLKALCASNLPDPSIKLPGDHFNISLYDGNGSTQSITGVGFQPDLLYGKVRNDTYDPIMSNSISGTGKYVFTLATAAEVTNANGITSFDSDGFSIGSQEEWNPSLTVEDDMVVWSWLGAAANASNGDGDITSVVRANTTSGFSVVSWAGTSSQATVGHGLSVAPTVIWIKDLTGTNSWIATWPSVLTAANYSLELNNDYAESETGWSGVTSVPTSTIFNVANNSAVNASGRDYIAFCFHPVDGFSSMGRYDGNSSEDGTFVYTGFRPAFVLVKRFDGVTDWNLSDTARNPFNPAKELLFPNKNRVETAASSGSYAFFDIVSNGFKFRGTSGEGNVGDYVYLAFAKFPFKYANAR